ncbi:MAG TPA: hypothetical protein VFT60_03625 [Bryobacteraceae bacterium]|nr:hypothetical protein [Bryobacteraceae bacterium]
MNARIYGMLLRLYPAELRRDFGAEMIEVFLEDLASGRPARVWWCSIRELFRIALPAAFSQRYVLVPAMLYLLMALDFGSIMMFAPRDVRSPLFHSAAESILLLIFPGLASAAIAFVALYVGDRAVPEPLSLR